MRKPTIIRLFLALLLCLCLPVRATLWRSYTAYSDITQVQKAGNTLYVLASKRLFAYNTADESIQTFDRINGLSDTPIAFIAWNNVAKRLVVVYDNQNIDFVMPNGEVQNLSDLYHKNMMVDKTVFGINTYGANTYLATGFMKHITKTVRSRLELRSRMVWRRARRSTTMQTASSKPRASLSAAGSCALKNTTKAAN